MTDTLVAVPDVEHQLGVSVTGLIADHVNRILAKRTRNRERAAYYDMRNLFQDLGIAVPPKLRNVKVAMGWPAKAVDELSRRLKLEAFVLPGSDVADWGIPELWTTNRMATEAPQAHTSALIHSCAFILTSQGDPDLGEPEVMLSVHDALHATGVWDPGRRALSSALIIMSEDEQGPTRFLFLTPTAVADIRYSGNRWTAKAWQHGLGRVPVEPLVYRPRLGRPFGSSRISRSVMSLTDSAMRTVVRAEVGAEFYSAPQRYLLGADEDMFEGPNGEKKSVWDLVMGRILSAPLERDEETGEFLPTPEVGQFPQISMQPHSDQLRMWATMFAGETRLPLSSLGIVQDNPASAEAIYAAEKDLIIEAEGTADGFDPAWSRAMTTAIQLRDGLPEPPAELQGLAVRWRDPSLPSRAAATDSVMKLVSAGILPADSQVTLEQLGLDETTVQRVMADRRRTAGRAALAAMATTPDQASTDTSGAGGADDLKKKFDALSIAIRAGVDPQNAATRLGLPGIEFTGAVPISLRQPESEANKVEDK